MTGQTSDRLSLGLLATYTVFPTKLPLQYLGAISGRNDIRGTADLEDSLGLSARAGLNISPRLAILGVVDVSPTNVLIDVAATRASIDVLTYSFGVDILYSPGALYAIAGIGVLTLDSELAGSESSLSWTPGVGYRHKRFRFELRDRVTVNTLSPSTESTFLHTIQFSTGIVLSP